MTQQRKLILSIGFLALVAALAYLPYVLHMGYAHDDWFTLASKVSGVSLREMHAVDRPLMGRLYQATYNILGDAPLGWHLYAFGVRLVDGLLFFLLLQLLWPGHLPVTTLMSALFLVYPGYLSQVYGNNYQNHLVGLGVGLVSILLTVLAIQTKRTWAKVLLSLGAAALVLIYPRIYEALIGLEGLRLILIVYLTWNRQGHFWRNLGRVFLYWLPYLVAIAYFVYWRTLIFKSGRSSVDAGALLQGYLGSPLLTLLNVAVETGRDALETGLFAWFVPAAQRLGQTDFLDLLLALLLAGGVVAGYIFYVHKVASSRPKEDEKYERGWLREAVLIGILSALAALLAVNLTGRSFDFEAMNRYSLVAALGVCMAVGALVFLMLKGSPRLWVAGLLLALSILTQLTNAVYFRDYWDVQRQFWWQMAWRVPGLKDETALVPMLPDDYRLAEDFEAWAPANAIFHPGQSFGGGQIPITAEVLNRDTLLPMLREAQVWRGYRQIGFTKKFNFMLLVSQPTRQSCARLLDSKQSELSASDDPLVYLAAPFSHLEQVTSGNASQQPPAVIFGTEPAHTWCYYYQKASLARQQGDWPEVARLGGETSRLGYKPSDVVEWLPFYEGYFLSGRMDESNLLEQKLRGDENVWHSFCAQFSLPGFDGHIPSPNAAVSQLCR